MPVETDPEEALRRLAPRRRRRGGPRRRARGAGLAQAAARRARAQPRPRLRGARALRLDPPRYEPVGFDGPKLAVIGTGKRTGKTAVAGPLGGAAARPGRGPGDRVHGPRRAGRAARGGGGRRRSTSCSRSRETRLARGVRLPRGRGARGRADGRLPARGRRLRGRAVRVERAGRRGARGVARSPGAIVFEGSGACIPPVEVDRTVCILGAGPPEPFAEYRLRARRSRARGRGRARSDPPSALPFVAATRAGSSRCRRTPAWRCSPRARPRCDGVPDPVARVHQPRAPRGARRRPRPGGGRALRRLPDRAEGGRHRHRRRARPRRRARASSSSATGRSASTTPSSSSYGDAPETIVVHKGHGLPYSKGLMAQAISATGLAPERSFELARMIEQRLDARAEARSTSPTCTRSPRRCCSPRRARPTARRYASWRRLDRLDRPLVVLLGGTTGVGKSTIATMLAARLGREPRDRDGRDPPGAPGILHP